MQASRLTGNSLTVFGGWVVGVGGGGGLKVPLVFCFGPKPKFCSFDLDLDQAEQYLNGLVRKSFLYPNSIFVCAYYCQIVIFAIYVWPHAFKCRSVQFLPWFESRDFLK